MRTVLDVLGIIGGSLTALALLHQAGVTWWRVRILWNWFESEKKISDSSS